MKNAVGADAKAHCERTERSWSAKKQCRLDWKNRAKGLFNRCDKNNNGHLRTGEVMDCLAPSDGSGTSIGGINYK